MDERMYTDLADWWPLISSPTQEDYATEAGLVAERIGTEARTLLELGSGGGNNALHLKQHYAMTLTDVSSQMLAVSRRLNPECEHIEGDMRTLRLGREFDAVFAHDAISYMVTVDDLRDAARTAFVHCRPGGIAVFEPDETAETFKPSTECGGNDGDDGRAARYLEWVWDPDPHDQQITAEYVLVLRDAEGRVETITERHNHGLFTTATWVEVLSSVGFEVNVVREPDTVDWDPRDLFVCYRSDGDFKFGATS